MREKNEDEMSLKRQGHKNSIPSSDAKKYCHTDCLGSFELLVCFMFFSLYTMDSSNRKTSLRASENKSLMIIPSTSDVSNVITSTPRPASLRRETDPPLARPNSFGLLMVADLDKKSKDESSEKSTRPGAIACTFK